MLSDYQMNERCSEIYSLLEDTVVPTLMRRKHFPERTDDDDYVVPPHVYLIMCVYASLGKAKYRRISGG